MKTIQHLALAVAVCALASTVHAQAIPEIARPKHTMYPGATNPAITPANIKQNICAPKTKWTTDKVRPPTSYTNVLKTEQLKNMGRNTKNPLPMKKSKSGTSSIPNIDKCVANSANPRCWEEDHLISLQLGGAPRDPDNLWPEPWFGDWNAKDKDSLESRLNAMVCSGDIDLREAQKEIAVDWVAAYKKHICDGGTKLTAIEEQACARFE